MEQTILAKAKHIPEDVAAIYRNYPVQIQHLLLGLRELIFLEAAADRRIGPVTETLKWGEPSYLTHATKSGTTVRLAWSKKQPNSGKLLVHCGTNLVQTWRGIYSSELEFEGNRAILFAPEKPYPQEVVRHCIHMALTYHINK